MRRPLWFKAKRYGYGWYPATWQGWMVIAIYLALFFGAYVRWDVVRPQAMSPFDMVAFVIDVSLSTGALLAVSALTGEKARWRWGD